MYVLSLFHIVVAFCVPIADCYAPLQNARYAIVSTIVSHSLAFMAYYCSDFCVCFLNKIPIWIFSRLHFYLNYCRCAFMYGESTDKEMIGRLDYTLENQLQDQFEMLLYKSSSKFCTLILSLDVSVCKWLSQLFLSRQNVLLPSSVRCQRNDDVKLCRMRMRRHISTEIAILCVVIHGNISLSFNLQWHFIDILGRYWDCRFCFGCHVKYETCSFMLLIVLYW